MKRLLRNPLMFQVTHRRLKCLRSLRLAGRHLGRRPRRLHQRRRPRQAAPESPAQDAPSEATPTAEPATAPAPQEAVPSSEPPPEEAPHRKALGGRKAKALKGDAEGAAPRRKKLDGEGKKKKHKAAHASPPLEEFPAVRKNEVVSHSSGEDATTTGCGGRRRSRSG